ncbi:AMP-binding protein [Paenibacillus athensensis]|uniref:AMP-dependent synthetase n=1 Tax=Paenibacillus athensensis TaxID=1967502 RepID=A0A4Y8Q8D6_9BACL|nr:AMP-binding protein [Paenibacillus athensensis]MCD1257282.1 AMP-binding protein [Paenibacillus athensensis]
MIPLFHNGLDEAAARVPDKIAVFTDEASITYAELAEQSKRVAAWLHGWGLQRGERVAVLLPNGIETIVTDMAVSRLGGIFVNIHWDTKSYNLDHILRDSAPTLILSTRERAAQERLERYAEVLTLEAHWDEALACVEPVPAFPGISHDPVCLIYTSGSTGRPKAVVCGQQNMAFAAWAIQQRIGMRESDVIGNVFPLSFDYGLYQVLLSFQVGATMALGSQEDAGPLLIKKLAAWGVTGLPVLPNLAHTLIRMGKRAVDGLPKLRFITNSGGHLPHSYIEDMQALFPGCEVFVMFGLTECKRVSIMPPEEYKLKPEAVGRALPNTECIIIDEEGNRLPPGEKGELIVRGPHVMLGYWRAPELTAKRYRMWGEGLERTLFTGDLCSMDEDGYLYFHGRFDDMFKQKGFRVSVLEVEEAAFTIAGVRQAALLPPTEKSGPILFVGANLDADDVFDQLKERLEDYKLPAKVIVLDELPATPNGKTDKKGLQIAYAEELSVR